MIRAALRRRETLVSTEILDQNSKAWRAACMASSACSAPAFWWTPTTWAGRAGLRERILPSVLRRRPPMTRSYSRPSWLKTKSKAACMLRAFSGDLKSMNGSFTKPPWGERGRIRVVKEAVLMTDNSLQLTADREQRSVVSGQWLVVRVGRKLKSLPARLEIC